MGTVVLEVKEVFPDDSPIIGDNVDIGTRGTNTGGITIGKMELK